MEIPIFFRADGHARHGLAVGDRQHLIQLQLVPRAHRRVGVKDGDLRKLSAEQLERLRQIVGELE